MATERTFKLDIFKLLGQIDSGDLHIWEKLEDGEKSGFSPLVTMRWMSGVNDARQIIYLNELINPFVFPLAKHPDLLMKLLTCCSGKSPRRYAWLSASKKGSNKKVSLQIVQDYYGYSLKVAKEQLPLISSDDLLAMAEELGRQKEEINILKKELKDA